MENNLLNFTLFGEYSIKELTQEEFQTKTHCDSGYSVLTNFFDEVIRNNEKSDPSIKAKVEKILNRLNKITRCFGVYFGDEYVGCVSFANYGYIIT